MTNADPTSDTTCLTVRFVGETYNPLSELVFGREAELSLDENTYLHRQAGRFQARDSVWWLENLGSRLRLTMVSSDGSVLDLQPGGSSPLLGTAGEVSLTAGPTRYEIGYMLQQPQRELPDTGSQARSGVDTITYGVILTPRERDFAVVLAQNRLTGRLGPLPTHGEIAEIWGVSAKTVDNTLQRLRAKLRKQNLRSIQSTETLVEYLVTQGLVTMADLEWASIGSPTGPRPAATRTP